MRGFRRGAGRLLSRVGGLRVLGLQDVRSLEQVSGLPSGLELGTATAWGGRPVAIVVANRDGPDLVGWAPVAAALAPPGVALAEVIVIAPLIGPATRRAAETPAAVGPPVRLVAFPALADGAADLVAQETVPAGPGPRPAGAPARSVFDLVLRVLEGAAAVAGESAVRYAPGGAVVFLRGVPALRALPAGEGAAIEVELPRRRRFDVTGANFPSMAPELHEAVIEISRDPRLLDRVESDRARSIDRVATAAGVRVVGRWLPWNSEGSDPIDFVGIDADARPVLGLIRDDFTVSDVPSVVAALSLFEEQRELWAPEARGAPRVCIAAEQVETRAASVLEALGINAERVMRSGAGIEAEADSRGRDQRRSRRRRGRSSSQERLDEPRETRSSDEGRGRGGRGRRAAEPGPESAAPEPDRVESAPTEASDTPGRSRRRRGRGRGRGAERADPPLPESEALSEPQDTAAPGDASAEQPESERSAASDAAPLGERVVDDRAGADDRDVSAADQADQVDRGPAVPRDDAADRDDADSPDPVDEEVEATLAEVPTEEAAPDEALEKPAARPVRRSRAAIVARNDPQAVLAALVLARERRSIDAFWVCGQEGLVDFLKGRATDVGENADLLVVGFTAQPVARDTIEAAELFRDRLQWFDHHEWPIEDLERLRDALGRESIFISDEAANPLAAVSQVTERRNRFTTKLLDLSAGRLSETDMDRWGNRMVGLIKRLAAASGDCRPDIGAVLSGKPTELPEALSVFEAESRWVEENDARVVHFGEYQMVVAVVPEKLDAGEVARRLRLQTDSRLSLSMSDGGSLVMLGSAEEKRHIDVLALVDRVASRLSWAHTKDGADRAGRIAIDDLSLHPERFEAVIGEIVRNKSLLHG